jgi:hypothetical protein
MHGAQPAYRLTVPDVRRKQPVQYGLNHEVSHSGHRPREQCGERRLQNREPDDLRRTKADKAQYTEFALLAVNVGPDGGGERGAVTCNRDQRDDPVGNGEIAVQGLHQGNVGDAGTHFDVLVQHDLTQRRHIIDAACV